MKFDAGSFPVYKKSMKKLIAGNWKMNGNLMEVCTLMNGLTAGLEAEPGLITQVDFSIAPPYIHIALANSMLPPGIMIGAQNCASEDNGAFTGEISAKMLKEIGCQNVILGHSERRAKLGETSEMVADKVIRAREAGLRSIVCIGETLQERDTGNAAAVVVEQLRRSLPDRVTGESVTIAYEPVWAIGTGKTPTPEDVAVMHETIRHTLKEKLDNPDSMRILYGGSVKPSNAKELLTLPNVDGALVGGASLNAEQFLAIAVAVTV